MRSAPGTRLLRWFLLPGILVLLSSGLVAHAEDVPPPPPPPTGEAPPGGSPPIPVPPMDAPAADVPPTDAPSVDGPPPVDVIVPEPPKSTRARPTEPPPPGSAMPDWDLDHLSTEIEPPPMPRPDPFALKNLRLRHDLRTASADGRITPLRRIPQWVDVIERDEIEAWRPLDLGSLAARRPNVTIGDAGNPFLQIPGIRGLGGDRVKILTDGIWPSTQALGSQGGSLSLWDPESTERVEIYHGPGTYLRAVDSPGGFINVIPRRPRQHGGFSSDYRVRSSYDSARSAWRTRGEVDFGEGRVAALAGVTYTDLDDRETGSGTINPSSYNQLAADLALDYFLGPQSRVGLTVQFMDARNIRSPIQTGTVSQPSYERVFIGLSLSSFNVGSVFHGNRFSISLDGFLEDDDRAVSNAGGAGIGSDNDVTRYDLHLEGNLYLCEGHDTWAEISAGYARLERRETLLCVPTGPTRPQPTVPAVSDGLLSRTGWPLTTRADLSNCAPVIRDFEAEEYFISALLEDQIHDECYDLYGGARVDYFHAEDSNGLDEDRFLFAGAAGAAWHMHKRATFYGNVSYGRRRPTLFERGATEVVNGVILFGNQDLDPEVHGNVELGLKSSYRNHFSLQAAVFAHYVDQTIAPVDLVGGVQQYANRGDVWLYGAEFAGAWRPFRTIEGLEGFGSVGITRSSDASLIDDVPFNYRGGARYSVPAPKGYLVRRWYGELSARGAGSSRRGPLGGGAYTTGDLILGGQFDLARGRSARLNLGITNLLDKAYRPATAQLLAPGRSFFFSLGVDL